VCINYSIGKVSTTLPCQDIISFVTYFRFCLVYGSTSRLCLSLSMSDGVVCTCPHANVANFGDIVVVLYHHAIIIIPPLSFVGRCTIGNNLLSMLTLMIVWQYYYYHHHLLLLLLLRRRSWSSSWQQYHYYSYSFAVP